MRLMLSVVLFLLFCTNSFGAALDLPKDADGWTQFTPASDTIISYVCAGGTGTPYTSDNHPDWSHPFNPTGTIDCYPTFAAAYANVRSGYSDWVLFKRGETFYQNIGSIYSSGRSSTEPLLIGSYGSSGLSPVLKVGSSIGVDIHQTSSSSSYTTQFIAIQGLNFYAHSRNPSDPEYVVGEGSTGFNIQSWDTGNVVKNILLEGCTFSYFSVNNILASTQLVGTTDIDLRRNVIAYNYDNSAHAQGLFSESVNRMLLEENIFYHNGWLSQAGSAGTGWATVYNHNTYFASPSNTTFKNNIFMSSSSMQNKFTAEHGSSNIVLDNNLYIDGEIGIGIGTNYLDNEWRFVNPTITNNVFTEIGVSQPLNRTSTGWTIQIAGWDGGTIANNLELNNTTSMDGGYSLSIEDQSRNVSIHDNIFLGHLTATRMVYFNYSGNSSDISIYDNYFETPAANVKLVNSYELVGEFSFNGNQWYGATSPTFYVDPTTYTFSQWQTAIEPTGSFAQKSFPDRTRTVESYINSLGGGDTLAEFASKIIDQDRYSWDTNYTAKEVNDYLKDGFGIGTATPPTIIQGLIHFFNGGGGGSVLPGNSSINIH